MTQATDFSAGEDLQVQFLEEHAPANKIRLRRGSVVVGEATVLTDNPDTYLLFTMSWWRFPGEDDVAGPKRRVCAALVREATDLAERNGAMLLSIVGHPEDLIASGFSNGGDGSVWMRPAGTVRP